MEKMKNENTKFKNFIKYSLLIIMIVTVIFNFSLLYNIETDEKTISINSYLEHINVKNKIGFYEYYKALLIYRFIIFLPMIIIFIICLLIYFYSKNIVK